MSELDEIDKRRVFVSMSSRGRRIRHGNDNRKHNVDVSDLFVLRLLSISLGNVRVRQRRWRWGAQVKSPL